MFQRLHLWPRSLVGRVFALYSVTLIGFMLAGLALFYRHQFTVGLEDAQLRAESLAAVVLPTVSGSAVIGAYDTIRRTLERAVKAPNEQPVKGAPPARLLREVRLRLVDTNQPINVGGRDDAVLGLSFAPGRIAEQDRAEGHHPPRELTTLLRPTRRVLEAGPSVGTDEAVSQVFSVRDVTHETAIDQMETEFLSTAAHELRTPTISIYGFAELLRHRPLKPERQRTLIATIPSAPTPRATPRARAFP